MAVPKEINTKKRLVPSRYLRVRFDYFKKKALWIECSVWELWEEAGKKFFHPSHETPHDASIQSFLPQNV